MWAGTMLEKSAQSLCHGGEEARSSQHLVKLWLSWPVEQMMVSVRGDTSRPLEPDTASHGREHRTSAPVRSGWADDSCSHRTTP